MSLTFEFERISISLEKFYHCGEPLGSTPTGPWPQRVYATSAWNHIISCRILQRKLRPRKLLHLGKSFQGFRIWVFLLPRERLSISHQTGEGKSSSNVPWVSDRLVTRRVCCIVFFAWVQLDSWLDWLVPVHKMEEVWKPRRKLRRLLG